MQSRNRFRLHDKISLSMICSLLSMICFITFFPAAAFSGLQSVTVEGTYNLGASVAMGKVDGINVAVAGADLTQEGSAYVLTRGVNGWSSTAQLTAPDGVLGDNFGQSVALSDPFIIVGAPDAGSAGAAYIFKKGSANSWAYSSKLTPSDSSPSIKFGYSVAIDGDYAAVGFSQYSGTVSRGGAVDIYKYNGTDWEFNKRLTPSDSSLNSYFGRSVSISGSYVAVGAFKYPAGTGKGKVYIYELSNGNWTETATFTGTELQYLGTSVSLDGDYLVVGAEHDTTNPGAAYVYKRGVSGTWSQILELTAELFATGEAEFGDYFGSSVSVSLDSSLNILVGAKGKDSHGAAYLFDFDSSSYSMTSSEKLTDAAAVTNEEFGSSVVVADEFVIVGAKGFKDSVGVTTGAVFVDLSDSSVNIPPAIEFTDAGLNENGQIFINDTFNTFSVEFKVVDDVNTTLDVIAIDVQNITVSTPAVVEASGVNVENLTLPAPISITADTPQILHANVTPSNFGEALITVTVQDTGGKIAKASFTAFIKHAPTIDAIPDRIDTDAGSMAEDTPLYIVLTVHDLDYDDVTLEVSSSNPQLFAASGMVLDKSVITFSGSTSENVTLTLTPVADANSDEPVSSPVGEADITVKATDVGGSTAQTFKVHVDPLNDAPNAFTINNQTTDEDTELQISFSVSDNETSADALTVTASSGNVNLVPNDTGHIEVTGTGATRTLRIKPAWDANSDLYGPSIITVKVNDGALDRLVDFQLTVTPLADVPVVCFVEATPTVDCAAIPDQTILEDESVQLTFKVHHGDELPVRVTVTSGTATMLPNTDVNIDMAGQGRIYEPSLVNGEAEIILTLTPEQNKFGFSNIAVKVEEIDNAANNSIRYFGLTVTERNDLPVVSINNTVINEQYLSETDEDIPLGIDLVITDVDNPSTDLKIEKVETQSPLLVAQTGISFTTGTGSNQSINLTPFENANSGETIPLDTAIITVTVTDGTDPTGDSDTVSFDIKLTINPVNDAPEISGTPPITVNQDVYYEFIPTVSDIENNAFSFTIVNKPAWADFDPVTGKLSGTPGNDDVGNYTGIQITVTDDGTPNESATLPTFSIEVVDVNDPPTVSTIFNTPKETTLEDVDWSTAFNFGDIDPDEILNVTISADSTPSPADLIEAFYVDDQNDTKTVVMTGTTGSVNLKIVPRANKYGTARIKVSVSDGEAPAVEKFFDFEVISVNDPPTITIIDEENNMVEDETAATGAKQIRFMITDIDIEPLTVNLAVKESAPSALIAHYDFIAGLADQHQKSVPASALDPATGAEDMIFYLTLTDDLHGYSIINLTVTDPSSASASGLVYINVSSVNDAPEVGNNPAAPELAYVAEDYAYDPQVTDPDDGDILTYEFKRIAYLRDSSGTTQTNVLTLPSWLTLDPATGVLSGIPTNSDKAPGNALEIEGIEIYVKDQVAAPNTGEIKYIGGATGFNIDIKKNPLPPVISGFTPPSTMQENKILNIPFKIEDPNGDLLTLSLTSDALELFPDDQANLAITGDPALSYDAGNNEYTFQTEPGQTYDLTLVLQPVDEGNNTKFGFENPINLTLNVTDTDNMVDEEVFPMTVTAVEDPPTVTGVPLSLTYTVDQGEVIKFSVYDIDTSAAGLQTVNLMVGDPDWGNVTATVEIFGSTNPNLFESLVITNLGESVTFGDPPHQVVLPYVDVADGSKKKDERPLDVVITPAAHEHGEAYLRIKADDGNTAVYSEQFKVVVNNINDPPEITSVTAPDPIDEEGGLLIPFTVADWDSGDTLTITAVEANDDGTTKTTGNIIDTITLTKDGKPLTVPWTVNVTDVNVAQDIALELQATTLTDQYGFTNIKIEIRDQADLVIDDTELVPITVNGVDDVPTITFVDAGGVPLEITEVVINEGADPSTGTPPFPLTVEINDVEQTSVWVWVKSSDETLVSPGDFQLLVTGDPARELLQKPSLSKDQYAATPPKTLQIDLTQLADADLNGKATIDLIVSNDPDVEQTVLTFDIVVASQPDPPVFIGNAADITLWEDDTPPVGETSVNPVPVTVMDIDGGTLTLEVVSDDSAIIPNDVQHLILAGASGVVTSKMTTYNAGNPVSALYTLSLQPGVETPLELTVKPADDKFTSGTPVSVTLKLKDGTCVATSTCPADDVFEVTVMPVNDPPELRELADTMTIDMNTTKSEPFKVYDVDSAFTDIDVYATKPDGSILPAVSITEGAVSGFEKEFVLVVNSGNTSGNAEVTVHVLDISVNQGQPIEKTVGVVVKENALATPNLITFEPPPINPSITINEGGTFVDSIEVSYNGLTSDLSFKVEKETLDIVGDLNIQIGTLTQSVGIVHTYPLTIQHSGDGPFTGDASVTLPVTIIVQGTAPIYSDSETFDLVILQENDPPAYTYPAPFTVPATMDCADPGSLVVETYENIPLTFSFKVKDPEGDVIYLDANITDNPSNVIQKIEFTNVSNSRISPPAPNIPAEVFMKITPVADITGAKEATIEITAQDEKLIEKVITCFTVRVLDSNCPVIEVDNAVEINRNDALSVPITIRDDHEGVVTVTAAWEAGSITGTSFTLQGTDAGGNIALQAAGTGWETVGLSLEITGGVNAGTGTIKIDAVDESGKNCPKVITLDVRACLEGDIDCGGTVELADAIIGLQTLSGMSSTGANAEADMDGDNKISLAEILFVLRFIAGL